MLRTLTLLLVLLGCHANIRPPIPVPVPAPGRRLEGGSRDARLVLEAFLELNCWDSALVWPVLQRLAKHYPTDRVTVIVHQVPLPYHRNSMIATQGLHVVEVLRPSKVTEYVDAVYDNLVVLSNSRTSSMTDARVLDFVADIAARATGINRTTFKYSIGRHRAQVVSEWKYGVRRGVAGTPWYVVNGVDAGVNPSTFIGFNTWVQYIDGLLR